MTFYHTPLKLVKFVAFLFSDLVNTYLDSHYSSSQKHLHNSYARQSLLSFHTFTLSYFLSYCSFLLFLFLSLFYLASKYWDGSGLVSSLSTPGIANSDAYKLQIGHANEWCRVTVFWMHRNILKFQRNMFPPFFFFKHKVSMVYLSFF